MNKRKLLTILGTTAAILFLLYYILFWRFPSSFVAYDFDLTQVRKLAGTTNLPHRIDGIVVAEGAFPTGAVVAGASMFSRHPMVFSSLEIKYKDKSVIVDTAHDKKIQDQFFEGNPFYQSQFDTMQKHLKKASAILITHEHMDHVGGISHSPFFSEISPHTFLTAEQLTGPTIKDASFPEGAINQLKPLKYEHYHAFMPGIVLIKAPGHSVGSQMVYVKLESGREYLFVGDIAWDMDNVMLLRGRPLLVSLLFLREDRGVVLGQLRVIKELAEKENITVIVAHDKDQWDDYVKTGLIGGIMQ